MEEDKKTPENFAQEWRPLALNILENIQEIIATGKELGHSDERTLKAVESYVIASKGVLKIPIFPNIVFWCIKKDGDILPGMMAVCTRVDPVTGINYYDILPAAEGHNWRDISINFFTEEFWEKRELKTGLKFG